MFIQIDTSHSATIYEQIVQQVKFAIASGSLLADEMIPSVRDLSKQLAINPNTVARAYRTLQDEGIVYSRRGMGLAVAVGAPERCHAERRIWFESQFRQLLAEAVRSKLAAKDIQEIIKQALEIVNSE